MSRSCYSDDYGDDFPGQLALYRGNVRRSIRSKAGQARLRELRDALLALPVKALAEDIFVEPAADHQQPVKVCALGAWALAQHGGDAQAAAEVVTPDAGDQETADALSSKGWPKLVVFEAIYENDRDEHVYVEVEGPHESPYAYPWPNHSHGPVRYRRDETPTERYARVLAWVEEQIAQPTGEA